ncbi:unnamed protein product [Arctogadus glacialis]
MQGTTSTPECLFRDLPEIRALITLKKLAEEESDEDDGQQPHPHPDAGSISHTASGLTPADTDQVARSQRVYPEPGSRGTGDISSAAQRQGVGRRLEKLSGSVPASIFREGIQRHMDASAWPRDTTSPPDTACVQARRRCASPQVPRWMRHRPVRGVDAKRAQGMREGEERRGGKEKKEGRAAKERRGLKLGGGKGEGGSLQEKGREEERSRDEWEGEERKGRQTECDGQGSGCAWLSLMCPDWSASQGPATLAMAAAASNHLLPRATGKHPQPMRQYTLLMMELRV